MTTGPDQSVGGGQRSNQQMAASFDVLVQSVTALNSSVRQLSDDIRRNFDAQARFTPGAGANGFRQARDAVDGQVRVQHIRGSAHQYDPAVGVTTPVTLRQAAMSMNSAQVWAMQQIGERIAGPGQDIYQTMQRRQQSQHQPQPAPPAFGTADPGQFLFDPQAGQPRFSPLPQFGGGSGGGPGGGSGGPGGPGGGGGAPGGPGGSGGGGGPSWRGRMGAGFVQNGARMMSGAQESGGGWTNSMLGGMRRLPYVGLAVGISARATDIYLSEREKNRTYQGMEGGSNAAGFGERFREETYRWGMGMGMSGDMARQSFKGVTALGYTDKFSGAQGRQDALNFVYHNYNARGMDPEESMNMLQTASKDATVNFKELSEALKDVSDTAGKAGVNAKLMRQSFQQMLGTAINTGAGAGSADLARIFSSTQASYGRQFQGQDFSGQMGTGYQYMIGAQYGVQPGQLQRIMRSQPEQYARMVSGSQMSMIKMVFSADQIQQIQGLIKQYGTTQVAVATIEQEFLNSNPQIDLHVIAATLSQSLTGVQLDESNVMDWVVQQLAGNTAAAHAQNTGGGVKPVDAKNTKGANTGRYGLMPKGEESVPEQLKKANAPRGFLSTAPGARFFGAETENKASKTYLDKFYNKGKRDPVLEALLQNVDNPNETKVKVATSKGDRIVSFEEAMRLFPNELASGKVTIMTGKQAGRTTSDVVGGNVDPTRDIRKELQQDKGETLGHWEKKHGKIGQQGAGGSRVTIDLSEEAKRVFKVVGQNESAATGYPPYNPNSHQGSRP